MECQELKDNLHFDRNQSGLRWDFKLAYRNEFLSYEHNFSFNPQRDVNYDIVCLRVNVYYEFIFLGLKEI